jgi:aspartyl-tRNA(Asn)/glutamyl-tRNA(Gln) amidotransferase subunit A
MHTKSLKQLSALIQGKQLSATELAELYLARIGASDLNALIRMTPR